MNTTDGGNVVRVRVDPEACAGHARCFDLAPDVFTLDDDGYNALRGAGEVEITGAAVELVRRAALACPERAIEVIDVLESSPS
jgi:ferredoxin